MGNTGKWIVAGLSGLLLGGAGGGCVEQTMKINSDPPGALVYLNQQEVGRTPLERDFKWYGDYDVQLRLEGYETLKTHQKVIAPWWNWPPFDLISSLLPFSIRDDRAHHYTLKPLDPAKDQPAALLDRAAEMKGQLESSEFTREPTERRNATTTSQPATTRPAAK